jgi:hypothetical protein
MFHLEGNRSSLGPITGGDSGFGFASGRTNPGIRSQVELRDTFAFKSHSVRHRMSSDLYSVFGAQRVLEVLGSKSRAGFSATGRGSEFAGRTVKYDRQLAIEGSRATPNPISPPKVCATRHGRTLLGWLLLLLSFSEAQSLFPGSHGHALQPPEPVYLLEWV